MKNKHGFSLLELILSIGIMGLLIAALLPQFSGIRDKALDTSVKAAALTIQTALESYSMEYSAYPDGTLSAAELNELLLAEGFLNNPLKNPYTQQTYSASDHAGAINYQGTDDSAGYTLTAYKRDGSTVLLQVNGGVSHS